MIDDEVLVRLRVDNYLNVPDDHPHCHVPQLLSLVNVSEDKILNRVIDLQRGAEVVLTDVLQDVQLVHLRRCEQLPRPPLHDIS